MGGKVLGYALTFVGLIVAIAGGLVALLLGIGTAALEWVLASFGNNGAAAVDATVASLPYLGCFASLAGIVVCTLGAGLVARAQRAEVPPAPR
jgi:hypothetical protein